MLNMNPTPEESNFKNAKAEQNQRSTQLILTEESPKKGTTDIPTDSRNTAKPDQLSDFAKIRRRHIEDRSKLYQELRIRGVSKAHESLLA